MPYNKMKLLRVASTFAFIACLCLLAQPTQANSKYKQQDHYLLFDKGLQAVCSGQVLQAQKKIQALGKGCDSSCVPSKTRPL
jgi:hypothetical protein